MRAFELADCVSQSAFAGPVQEDDDEGPGRFHCALSDAWRTGAACGNFVLCGRAKECLAAPVACDLAQVRMSFVVVVAGLGHIFRQLQFIYKRMTQ